MSEGQRCWVGKETRMEEGRVSQQTGFRNTKQSMRGRERREVGEEWRAGLDAEQWLN